MDKKCGNCLYADVMLPGKNQESAICWCWQQAKHVRSDGEACGGFTEDMRKKPIKVIIPKN